MTTERSTHAAICGIRDLIADYLTLIEPIDATILAVWTVLTHVYRRFDAVPYLVITSATKQSGKTRLAEILSLVSAKAKLAAALTPAVMFRLLDAGATLFFDEAETLNSESAGVMRSMLNVGYRAGQTIDRTGPGGVVEYNVYGPKAFILIGDVYDTLRDRSIIIEMRRRPAPKFFRWMEAKARAECLRPAIDAAIQQIERDHVEVPREDLSYLGSRDAEIWCGLMAIAECLCSDADVRTMQRRAIDMATLKTRESRRYTQARAAEETATDDTYGARVLQDMLSLATGDVVFSTGLVEALKAIDLAPWRTYRGEGLNAMTLASLLRPYGIAPRWIKRNKKTLRGYRVADIRAGLTEHGKTT